jgi:hypothetical protein
MAKLTEIYNELLVEFISQSGLNKIEDYLDKMFEVLKIDIEFSGHFHDRLNDPRNGKEIESQELINSFNRLYQKHGQGLVNHRDLDAVLTDFNNNLNIPFHLSYDKRKKEFELVNKTIMRTNKFNVGNRQRKLKV